MKRLDPNEFIGLIGNLPVVDVRSPSEFREGHIPGAFNIPLFDDNERALIGTIYKQTGRQEAIDKGLEIAGPKMQRLAREAINIAENKKLMVYCWRGGMRSEKMAWLFETAGIQCLVLNGGYKTYRKQLLLDFYLLKKLVVLHGATGSGKTEILSELSRRGEQIIDLEHFANHRGSAFGHIGKDEQPTTMQFQNDLHAFLNKLNKDKRIWVEGESLSIGKVYLPDSLWQMMNKAPVILLHVPKKIRAARIIREYGRFEKQILVDSIQKIEKRFGGDRVKKAIQYLAEDRMEEATELLLDYYDKNYSFSLEKYKEGTKIEVTSDTADASFNADLILNKIRSLNL